MKGPTMKVTQEFLVSDSPEAVWRFFQDIPAVADCLPGAELLGTTEDGSYEGRLSVKLGPMASVFEGKAAVQSDMGNMTAIIEGSGIDRNGGSRGRVTLTYLIEPDPAGSRVNVDADVSLAGPAAQFGRTGLISETSKRLINEFVACLEGRLSSGRAESDNG